MLLSLVICGVYYIALLHLAGPTEQATLRREFLLVCSSMILVVALLNFRTAGGFADVLVIADTQMAAQDLLLLFPMRRLLEFI